MKYLLLSLAIGFTTLNFGQNKKIESPNVILLNFTSDELKKELEIPNEILFLQIELSDTVLVESKGDYKTHNGVIYSNNSDSIIGDFIIKQTDFIYLPTYIEFVLSINDNIYTIHYSGYHQLAKTRGIYFEVTNNKKDTKMPTDFFIVKKGKMDSKIDKQLKK